MANNPNAIDGPCEPLSFSGYDSMTSLYLWSEWELATDGDPSVDRLGLMQAVLFRLIAHELGWQEVFAAQSSEKYGIKSIAVWKLPPEDPGTAYLAGINSICTWDEYAVLSQYIRRWDANLFRSSGFSPARLEDPTDTQRAAAAQVIAALEVPFKEDLIIAYAPEGQEQVVVRSGDVRMRYLTVSAYKQRNVTGKYPYVETLARNGVIQANVPAQDDLDGKAFKFINLSGLQERTRWL